jgi:type IV pilus assembly protein PilA
MLAEPAGVTGCGWARGPEDERLYDRGHTDENSLRLTGLQADVIRGSNYLAERYSPMSDLPERFRARRPRFEEVGEEGFTLIELLVVLLIIGILLAIAIPTFLSVTKTANNTAAQANLQTALTGADTYYTSSNQTYAGLYGGTTTSSITAIDTGLTYVSGSASTKSNSISINALGSAGWVVLAAWAPGTKDCWVILDQKSTQASGGVAGNTTYLAPGTYYGVIKSTTTSSCVASSTIAVPAAIWTQTGFPHG